MRKSVPFQLWELAAAVRDYNGLLSEFWEIPEELLTPDFLKKLTKADKKVRKLSLEALQELDGPVRNVLDLKQLGEL
jgi:hypothetical protein